MEGIFVTQKELSEIAEHQQEIAWRSKRLEELNSNVKVLLQGGAIVEPGRFFARLTKRFGRSIPWKKCVIDNLGYEFAEKFKRQYPLHIFSEVKVVEYAVLPLWRNLGEGSDSKN